MSHLYSRNHHWVCKSSFSEPQFFESTHFCFIWVVSEYFNCFLFVFVIEQFYLTKIQFRNWIHCFFCCDFHNFLSLYSNFLIFRHIFPSFLLQKLQLSLTLIYHCLITQYTCYFIESDYPTFAHILFFRW